MASGWSQWAWRPEEAAPASAGPERGLTGLSGARSSTPRASPCPASGCCLRHGVGTRVLPTPPLDRARAGPQGTRSWWVSAGPEGAGRARYIWRRQQRVCLGFGRKASSQSVISQQVECLKELEELKFEIQKCQFERDELYQILDLYIYDDWDHRLDVELPVLQSEHEMRMMAMQMMTNSISDAMERYKELIQVNSSYRIRQSQLLREQAQLENNIQILLNEKRKLLVEQTELPASSVETKRFCEEAGMNICDPRAKQQQV